MKRYLTWGWFCVLPLFGPGWQPGGLLAAEPLVPGTGIQAVQVGDDFEAADWSFRHNLPKSSEEQDGRTRLPAGGSTNGRWYEGMKRGQPDIIERVPVPEGGLPGSTHALRLRTRQSGIPGRISHQMQQDDLICNVDQRLGGKVLVSQQPSVVVRVFMPPIATWERRSGATFGFRISLDTTAYKVPEGERRPRYVKETYWPGMFVEFQSQADRGRQYDTAYWRIRADQRGRDFRGPQITETGWWTLGMSVTPDGQVHYYIRQGIEDLTAEDHIGSQFPYGYKAERFKTFFFNVCNRDDGRTWSTEWIIDDPSLYFVPTERANVASRPGRN